MHLFIIYQFFFCSLIGLIIFQFYWYIYFLSVNKNSIGKHKKEAHQNTHDVYNGHQKESKKKKKERKQKTTPPSNQTQPINENNNGHRVVAYKQSGPS